MTIIILKPLPVPHANLLKYLKRPLILLASILLYQAGVCQDSISPLDKINNLPTRFFAFIGDKTAKLDARLEKQTEKYLQRIARKESKLRRKLAKIDSTAAQIGLGDTEKQYEQFTQSLRKNISDDTRSTIRNCQDAYGGEYLPYADSVKGALLFFQQNNGILSNEEQVQHKISGSLKNINHLELRLQQSEQVKEFVRRRKEQIKQVLSKYAKLPKGITGSYNDLTKEFYYYSVEVNKYKELLNDPDKLTKKVLTLLGRSKGFQSFMKQHSLLAELFGGPDNYGTPLDLSGLQTRMQVQQVLQTQLSSAGPNAQQMLQQNLQAAQAQLNELRGKINKWGNSGGDIDMPDFKPNTQKTKTFFQRLEYGTNLQTTKSNYSWPVTTDLGLSVGYRVNDKSIIGVGASYKVGWGKDIRHVVVTQEGLGLRSFVDFKLKKSFYASGGFEYNYQPAGMVQTSFLAIPIRATWQKSGLIGVSKVVSITSKFFKKTKVQLLWDFLSYQQVPQTQALKFRVGYNF
jgi:hypothetical protein